MRLINTKTLELKDVDRDDQVEYAILSHRWEDQEVSFNQMKHGNASSMQGYKKIKHACEEALKGGYEYIWIDTCCIDKTSSAELSEAINSMYRWYQQVRQYRS